VRQAKPAWLRAKAPVGENFHNLKKLARGLGLHTVSSRHSVQYRGVLEPAHGHVHAAGRYLYPALWFCAVPRANLDRLTGTSRGESPKPWLQLGLKHTVVTSVNRDDDNWAGHVFSPKPSARSASCHRVAGEVLIPDFQGLDEALKIVLGRAARCSEPQHRDGAAALSGGALGRPLRADPAAFGKREGACAGDRDQIRRDGGAGRNCGRAGDVFRDLGSRGVIFLQWGNICALVGPSAYLPFLYARRIPVLKKEALQFGFRHVESGPLVRSSYHAHEQAEATAEPRLV